MCLLSIVPVLIPVRPSISCLYSRRPRFLAHAVKVPGSEPTRISITAELMDEAGGVLWIHRHSEVSIAGGRPPDLGLHKV